MMGTAIAVVRSTSGIHSDSGTGTGSRLSGEGAKDRVGIYGSRSTISDSSALSCGREEEEVLMVGRGAMAGEERMTGKGSIGVSKIRGRGARVFCTELFLFGVINLSEKKFLLPWSRRTGEGVSATKTWTFLSCWRLFPPGAKEKPAEAQYYWLFQCY
jgi:hypothetical protein